MQLVDQMHWNLKIIKVNVLNVEILTIELLFAKVKILNVINVENWAEKVMFIWHFSSASCSRSKSSRRNREPFVNHDDVFPIIIMQKVLQIIRERLIQLEINENKCIFFDSDTGTALSALSLHSFRRICPKADFEKGEIVEPLGTCMAQIKYIDQ